MNRTDKGESDNCRRANGRTKGTEGLKFTRTPALSKASGCIVRADGVIPVKIVETGIHTKWAGKTFHMNFRQSKPEASSAQNSFLSQMPYDSSRFRRR